MKLKEKLKNQIFECEKNIQNYRHEIYSLSLEMDWKRTEKN